MAAVKTDVSELKNTTEILKIDVSELKDSSETFKTDIAVLKDSSESTKEELRVLSFKLMRNTQSINDLRLDLNIFKEAVSKEFHSLNDKMDTVIEVLREKELLPR